jgi:hypothetical protein
MPIPIDFILQKQENQNFSRFLGLQEVKKAPLPTEVSQEE